MQETAPTQGGLLMADETTAVGIKGAWRWGTIVYYHAAFLLSYMQQGGYTDRPLAADDVPRGRYRALVVASPG